MRAQKVFLICNYSLKKGGYTLFKVGNCLTLTINAGSLKYLSNAWYEVYVSTLYMNREYGQRVQINILEDEQLPIVFLELSIIFYINSQLKNSMIKSELEEHLKIHYLLFLSPDVYLFHSSNCIFFQISRILPFTEQFPIFK